MRTLLPVVLLLGCSDFGVTVKPEDTGTPVTDTEDSAPPVETATDSDTSPPEDSGGITIPTEPCTDVDFTADQWWGSQPFTTESDLTDSSARPFYSVDFDLTDWSTVSMPDEGHIPSGSDKAYRGTVNIPTSGERIFIDLQSDDGLWVYVNGAEVGHWGGEWQEEGCVNDEAGCTVTTTVDPVEITDFVNAGDNVFAARVSNAIDNSYFMLHAYCAD